MLIIEEDRITFHIEKTHQTFKARILKDDREYYFVSCVIESVNGRSLPKCNDDFLIAAGFDTKAKQKDLYESVLGYWIDGSESIGWWPWCRTKENLVKILYSIDEKRKDAEFVDISVII